MENIKAADEAWEARRMEEFVPWEKEGFKAKTEILF